MAEYTPGPWTIWNEELELDPEYATGPPLITAPGTDESIDIAEVSADCDGYVANARLIAAAPDLLVALKDLQREVHNYRLLDVRKRFSLCTADAQAGTAIFKAEGKQ